MYLHVMVHEDKIFQNLNFKKFDILFWDVKLKMCVFTENLQIIQIKNSKM